MPFQPLADYLDSLRDTYQIPGNRCVVYRNHHVVFSHSAGYADWEKTRKTSPSDLHPIYSATKLSTCTAVMQLVEKGALSLTDPLSRYLPEFASVRVREGDAVRPAVHPIRIADLLSMSAGLTYDIDTPEILAAQAKWGRQATTRQMIGAIAGTPLSFEPGTHYCYSLCHDVLAAVVEVVSGEKFSQYLQEHLFAPLGMDEVWFTVPESLKDRIVPQYRRDPATGLPLRDDGLVYRLSDAYESGGAGIYTTCDCYAKLIDALAGGGTGATGAVILHPQSIDEMRTNRLDPVRLADFREPRFASYGYGLGVRTRMDSRDSHAPVGEFGWDGAAGAYALADPENGLSLFFTMQVLDYYPQVYAEVHPRIRELTYECLGLV